eukprot:TRINITY_DN227_c0_g1_i1.p10 TRINITY_DN227_c0_g1~~TRINITY_DN227_c0_g1_i1.p10  ORF type:complete len:106 (+),score=17.20 TRINITY_DN227_c0_g1_i1:516-833(+)
MRRRVRVVMEPVMNPAGARAGLMVTLGVILVIDRGTWLAGHVEEGVLLPPFLSKSTWTGDEKYVRDHMKSEDCCVCFVCDCTQNMDFQDENFKGLLKIFFELQIF